MLAHLLCELRAPAMTPDLLRFSKSWVLLSEVLSGSILERPQRGTKWVGQAGAVGDLSSRTEPSRLNLWEECFGS